jgi:hypothetical protein
MTQQTADAQEAHPRDDRGYTKLEANDGHLYVTLTPLGEMVADCMAAHDFEKREKRARRIAKFWSFLRILGVRRGG